VTRHINRPTLKGNHSHTTIYVERTHINQILLLYSVFKTHSFGVGREMLVDSFTLRTSCTVAARIFSCSVAYVIHWSLVLRLGVISFDQFVCRKFCCCMRVCSCVTPVIHIPYNGYCNAVL
jgi:hypothetical protein